ncbi:MULTISPECIES: PLD nuclease N-terminal domain-containing protein [Listeria]|uniref:PLD nuclease N-terminal domain-containing protein n=1 Tax=Listeria TaxID=1637 RepID=UPI000E759ABD|nr:MULTISPECIES: PLD nuclease N-terminal domain-containing protein [Listeria]EAF4531457.1 PLDc_N domain-containing protein [Listeria monocytogenes serotype 1/2a]EAD7633100.1 PLDc_N domain-containing protein [Listeria monocytogenes]EAD7633261.1 PLDc_N domain-containing protein [Listeria monocytogenes]EDH3594660.1 negative regulator of sigma-Y activity [Listeria monocytogenes]EKZ4847804.1 PLDc_N domain-containing protein [Listeria monocytogenes]
MITEEQLSLVLPVLVIHGVLILIVLFDMFKNGNRRKNKIIWLAVSVVFTLVGPVAYLILGRKNVKIGG